jgi:hypothetical protein
MESSVPVNQGGLDDDSVMSNESAFTDPASNICARKISRPHADAAHGRQRDRDSKLQGTPIVPVHHYDSSRPLYRQPMVVQPPHG